MRLERMNIQGFGAVRDKSLEIDAPVTVLYGPNEAGKSGVLYFIRAMLYGFPGKGSPAERGEPSEEGIHGGERGFWIRRECLGWFGATTGPEGNSATGRRARTYS